MFIEIEVHVHPSDQFRGQKAEVFGAETVGDQEWTGPPISIGEEVILGDAGIRLKVEEILHWSRFSSVDIDQGTSTVIVFASLAFIQDLLEDEKMWRKMEL